MSISDKIKRFKVIYSSDPLRQHLKIQDDGSIFNSVTGELFNVGSVEQNIQQAELNSIAYPISSVRSVSATGQVTGGLGAAALETRVAAVNNFLARATPEQLRELKLDRLIGKQVSGMQATFAIKNNKQILESIIDPGSSISKNFPGMTNITGEGLIRIGLRIAGEETPLSELEQLILLNEAGASYLTNSVITNFFHAVVASRSDDTILRKISQLVGKIPKRLQSELAPRDFSLGGAQLEEVFGNMGTSLKESLDLTNITDIVLKMVRGDVLTGTEAGVAKTIGSRGDAMQLIAKVSGLIGADPTENLDPYDVYSLLREQINNIKILGTSPNILEELTKTIEIVKAAAETAPDPDKMRQALEYERVVSSLANNLEPIRDGSVVMTETFMQNLINIKVKQFKELSEKVKSLGPGTVDREQLDLLRSLEGEIDKLRHALRSGTTSDNTIRFPLGEGIEQTVKAKTGILRFEDYEGSGRFNLKASTKNRKRKKKTKKQKKANS